MSAKLNLDWQEILWLAEGAIGKSHLRWSIYETLVNCVYPQLNERERENIYTYLKRDTRWHWEFNHRDDTPYHYWLKTLARFNPTNQYSVVMKDTNGVEQIVDAYMWNGKYYVSWERMCNDDFVVNVTHKKYNCCINKYCSSRSLCKRYRIEETNGEKIMNGAKEWSCRGCDFFISKDGDEVEQKD